MATVVWNSHGVIYIDYLEKDKTTIGLYYAELLGQSDVEKRPHLAKKLTPPPSLLVELGYARLPHPSYSPNLATYDSFLFRKLKLQLAGQKFK